MSALDHDESLAPLSPHPELVEGSRAGLPKPRESLRRQGPREQKPTNYPWTPAFAGVGETGLHIPEARLVLRHAQDEAEHVRLLISCPLRRRKRTLGKRLIF